LKLEEAFLVWGLPRSVLQALLLSILSMLEFGDNESHVGVPAQNKVLQ
jgi:hypothetical protein